MKARWVVIIISMMQFCSPSGHNHHSYQFPLLCFNWFLKQMTEWLPLGIRNVIQWTIICQIPHFCRIRIFSLTLKSFIVCFWWLLTICMTCVLHKKSGRILSMLRESSLWKRPGSKVSPDLGILYSVHLNLWICQAHQLW